MQATKSISLVKRNALPKENKDFLFFSLVIVALIVDVLTPYLRWKEVIPAEIRWASHAVIAVMMVLTFLRMMMFDRIPIAFWVILAISLIGSIVAINNNQGYLATAWGWWNMFQYLFVGLFAYLQPSWPHKFPQKLIRILIGILVVQVIWQFIQYALGESPGDNLAGLFGEHGTARLVIFILLVLGLALGAWIVKAKWQLLVLTLILGGISSVLGEIKLFPFAALGMGLLALFLFVLRGRSIGRLVPYALLLLGVIAIFVVSYNAFVPAAQRRPLEAFLDMDRLDRYFGTVNEQKIGDQYYYSVGRNFAVKYAWDSLKESTSVFLLGLGIGARGESETLGTSGVGFTRSEIGKNSGTSLLVIMQELGFLGFISLGGFFLWLILKLFIGIREEPLSDLTMLRYGLLLFSLMWPIWLWYTSVWVFRVAMLVYWVVVGYVLSHSDGRGRPITAASADLLDQV